jgi:hypothetical protein
MHTTRTTDVLISITIPVDHVDKGDGEVNEGVHFVH